MAKKLISYDDTKPGTGLPPVVEESLNATYAAKSVAGQGVMGNLYRSGAALRNIHAALENRTEKTCRLLFFGSSTTAGYNAPDRYGYVSMLGEVIQSAFPNTTGTEIPIGGYSPVNTPGVQITNLAFGNANSGDYVVGEFTNRLNNVALLEPDVVFHMIGANDWNTNLDPAVYKANVEWTIDEIDDRLPAPAVHVLIHQHERHQWAPRDYPFSAYRDALREIALSDPDHILLIDLTADWEMMGVPVPNPYGLLDTDNVHLTGRGHAFLAETLRERLAIPLMARTTTPPGDVTPPGEETPPPEEVTLEMVTSDGFGDDSTSLGTRPSDVAHGGTPITPTVANSSSIFTSGGNLVGSSEGGNLTWEHTKQDVEASIVLVAPPEVSLIGIYSRYTSSDNHAGAYIKVASIGAAVLRVNGTEYGGNQAYQAGDTIAVRSVGDVHQLRINGSVKATATVNGVTGEGSRIGMTDGVRVDDLKIAEVIPA